MVMVGNMDEDETGTRGAVVATTSKRVVGYILLALVSYGIGAGLGGAGAAAMLFVAGGIIFEGFIWMEARRAWKRQRNSSKVS